MYKKLRNVTFLPSFWSVFMQKSYTLLLEHARPLEELQYAFVAELL